jgi:hypothetical protein
MGGEVPDGDRNTRNVNLHEYNMNTKGEVIRSPLFIFFLPFTIPFIILFS